MTPSLGAFNKGSPALLVSSVLGALLLLENCSRCLIGAFTFLVMVAAAKWLTCCLRSSAPAGAAVVMLNGVPLAPALEP